MEEIIEKANITHQQQNGEFEHLIIKARETVTREISLTLNTETKAEGPFENIAKFTAYTQHRIPKWYVSSSDWIVVKPKGQTINKYIKTIDGQEQSRNGMSEEEKASNRVDLKCETDRKIVYKVDITSEGQEEITGKFYDESSEGIIVNKIIDQDGTDITNASLNGGYSMTIKGTSRTITIETTIKAHTLPGIYKNTSKFVIDGKRKVMESSDYFEIEYTPIRTGKLKKYISSVNDISLGDIRKDKDTTWKYEHPVEVERKATVTYNIELTFLLDDPNYSEYAKELNGYCPEHYNKRIIKSLSCSDVFKNPLMPYNLEDGLITGDNNVTFDIDKNTITWTNIEIDDITKEQTVTAQLKLYMDANTDISTNVGNTVSDIKYTYDKYVCYLDHNNWHEENTAKNGYQKWCDHSNCSFTHECTEVQGTLDGTDSDYIRLADPIIAGKVFLDIDNNNLYDGEQEQIKNMPKDQYKNVTVELWEIGDDNNERLVGTTSVDTETGEFSFGRVRKNGSLHATDGEVGDINIEDGSDYYYETNDLYTYYLVFNYDGEKFEAVRYAGGDGLNPKDYYAVEEFENNSSAWEVDREKFNERFQTISHNRAFANKDGTGDGMELKYTTDDENGNPTSRLQESVALWNGDTNSVLNMKAHSMYLSLARGWDYLKYINLGLRQRKQDADLSLTKDVVSAEVTVNGFKTTYNYEELGNGEFVAESDNTISKPYTLRIYREDYEYRTANQSKEIEDILNDNNPYKDYGRSNDLEI